MYFGADPQTPFYGPSLWALFDSGWALLYGPLVGIWYMTGMYWNPDQGSIESNGTWSPVGGSSNSQIVNCYSMGGRSVDLEGVNHSQYHCEAFLKHMTLQTI